MAAYSPPWVEPGWPNLPDMGQSLVSAAATGVGLNLKKQEIQGKLAALSLRNQQLENTAQHQRDMFELAQERLQQQAGHWGQMYDLAQQRMGLSEEGMNLRNLMFQHRINQQSDDMESIGDLAQGLGAINLPPDSQKRIPAIYDVIQKNARAAKLAPGLVRDAFSNYNNAFRATVNQFHADEADLNRDIRNSLGRGQTSDTDLLNNPEVWQYYYKDPQGGLHQTPPEGSEDWIKQGKWTRTDKKYVIRKDDQNKDQFISIPEKDLNELIRRRDDINRRRKELQGRNEVANEYTTKNRDDAEAYLKANGLKPSEANIQFYLNHPENQ